MSMPTTKRSAADAIARDGLSSALDVIEYGKEHARWLSALMATTHEQAVQGMTFAGAERVRALSSLGQYLADDCAGYLCTEGERLNRELDAADAESQAAADMEAALSAATAPRKRTTKEG